MRERPAEPDIWMEQIAPILLGVVVTILTQRIASLGWPAQLGIAVVVGLAWWWLIRTRLRQRQATHPEAAAPAGQPGMTGEPTIAEPAGPAQPPGALREPPRPAPTEGAFGSGRRPLLVALALAILLGILATLLYGVALVTTVVVAGWLLALVVLPTVGRLAQSLPDALRSAVSQVAAVSVGATIAIGGQAAAAGLLFPIDRLDGSWQVDQAAVVANSGVVDPSQPAMRWTLTERGSCPRSPCRYEGEGEDLPPTGQPFRFTLTLTTDREYQYTYDTVTDCIQTDPPHLLKVARGYRGRATYRVRPAAWSGRPGQRRPARLEVRLTWVAQATDEALAQRCTQTISMETLADARRTG